MPNRFSNRKRKIQSVIKHKRISTQIQNDSPTDLEPGFIPNAAQPRTDRWQEMCGHVRPGDAKFRFCSKIKAQKGFFRNKILQRNLRDVHPEKLKRSKMSLREKQRYYQEKSHMENSDTYQNQKAKSWAKMDSSSIKSTQMKRRDKSNRPLYLSNDDGRADCPVGYINCGLHWFENPTQPGRNYNASSTHTCCHQHDLECREANGCGPGSGRGRDR